LPLAVGLMWWVFLLGLAACQADPKPASPFFNHYQSLLRRYTTQFNDKYPTPPPIVEQPAKVELTTPMPAAPKPVVHVAPKEEPKVHLVEVHEAAPTPKKVQPAWVENKAVFSTYLRAMRLRGREGLQAAAQGYNVTIGSSNMCGPVPMRALAIPSGSGVESCAKACSDAGQGCVGFVVDTEGSKCLFRSWHSLTNCFERHQEIVQVDPKFNTYLKGGLSLSSFLLD